MQLRYKLFNSYGLYMSDDCQIVITSQVEWVYSEVLECFFGVIEFYFTNSNSRVNEFFNGIKPVKYEISEVTRIETPEQFQIIGMIIFFQFIERFFYLAPQET